MVNINNLHLPPQKRILSTGQAATAAAIAGLEFILNKKTLKNVLIRLASGEEIVVFINNIKTENNAVMATVTKSAGHPSDITAGVSVIAKVTVNQNQGLEILGGLGVGKLTKANNSLPIGAWAINTDAYNLIKDNLIKYLSEDIYGLKIELSIPTGKYLATQTLNEKLGISGGLAILATTGIEQPFSHETYLKSLERFFSKARNLGLKEVVLCCCEYSELFIKNNRNDLTKDSFIIMYDFFSQSLRLACDYGFKTIGLASLFGKALKQARGEPYTHTGLFKVDDDRQNFLRWVPGLHPEIKEKINKASGSRQILEIIKTYQLTDDISLIASRILVSAAGFIGFEPQVWVKIFDYNGNLLATK